MKLNRRKYRWSRKFDITGQEFGKLEAIKHVGFNGPMSVWLFRCQCGRLVRKRGPQVSHRGTVPSSTQNVGLSCGHNDCPYTKHRAHGLSNTNEYASWMQWLRKHHSLVPRDWRNFDVFFKQCLQHRNAKFLIRPDRTKAYGPKNYEWSAHSERHLVTIEKCAEILEASGQSRDAAWKKANQLTKQRRHQIIAQASGLCPRCYKPRTKPLSGGALCNTCTVAARTASEKHKKSQC